MIYKLTFCFCFLLFLGGCRNADIPQQAASPTPQAVPATPSPTVMATPLPDPTAAPTATPRPTIPPTPAPEEPEVSAPLPDIPVFHFAGHDVCLGRQQGELELPPVHLVLRSDVPPANGNIFHTTFRRIDIASGTDLGQLPGSEFVPLISPNHRFILLAPSAGEPVTDGIAIFDNHDNTTRYYELPSDGYNSELGYEQRWHGYKGWWWSPDNRVFIPFGRWEDLTLVDPVTLATAPHARHRNWMDFQPTPEDTGFFVWDTHGDYALYTTYDSERPKIGYLTVLYSREKTHVIASFPGISFNYGYRSTRPVWLDAQEMFLVTADRMEETAPYPLLLPGLVTIDKQGTLSQILHFPSEEHPRIGEFEWWGTLNSMSEDGETLLVQERRFDKPDRYFLVDAGSGEATLLCEDEGDVTGGWWLPESRLLYLVDTPDGEPDKFRVVDIKTGVTTTVWEETAINRDMYAGWLSTED